MSAQTDSSLAQAGLSSQHPAQLAKSSKKPPIPLIVGIVIAVIVILVVILIVTSQGEDKANAPSISASQSSSSPITQSQGPTYENGLFSITLPDDVANKVSFSEEGDALSLHFTSAGVSIATICPQSDLPEYETEYKRETYTLGDVYVAGGYRETFLTLPFVDAEGKYVHAASKGSVALGIAQYLNMTPETFAACIALKTETGFKPAVLTSIGGGSSSSSQQSASSGVPTSAFWGIWANASKDEAEMEAEARRIKSDYGLDAFVVLTTDWSNLNSEPWYCVSLGSYSSEDAANAALAQAHAVYSDAYVKYSGAKK